MSKKLHSDSVTKLHFAERAAKATLYGLTAAEREARSNASGVSPTQEEIDEPLVKQAFKDEVDINNIIDKYMRTGVEPATAAVVGEYLDLSKIPDYEGALQTVIRAEEMFMELPAKVRDRFRNDPGELLRFLSDNANYEEAAKLGLLDEAAVARRSSKKTSDPAPKGGQQESPAAGDPGDITKV